MTLKEAIQQVLTIEELVEFDDVVQAIRRLCPNKKSTKALIKEVENFIKEEGIINIKVSSSRERIVHRRQLFRKSRFRIHPHELELEKKCMIIGHRLLPFVNPTEDPESLVFLDDEDKAIPVRTITLDPEEAYQFMMLLPPYCHDQYYQTPKKGRQLSLLALDLSKWLKVNPTSSDKDMWMITPIDYDAGRFRLSRLSSRQIAEQKLLINRHDDLLKRALLDIIEADIAPVPIDLVAFWAFANIADDTVVQNPGSPVGPFITGSQDWQIAFEGTFHYLQSHNFIEQLLEKAQEASNHFDPRKMGKSKTVQGILAELGSSYSESFVAAKLLMQKQDYGYFVLSEIYDILFSFEGQGFYNARQERNFGKAIVELGEAVYAKWEKTNLSLPSRKLLQTILELKQEIVDMLWELGAWDEEDQLEVLPALLQYRPIENVIDSIMENIVWGEQPPPRDIQLITEQMQILSAEFMAFKESMFGED